jgi:pimeloyl-ACP methyl ester carboxylesterase
MVGVALGGVEKPSTWGGGQHLFLHGAGSNVEEVAPLIQPIFEAGKRLGSQFSILALDMPSTGYSKMIKHEDIAPLDATTYPTLLKNVMPITTPVLDYIENFVVAFVNTLDKQAPFTDRLAGVIGGSLGGNLGLRLGERLGRQGSQSDCKWLEGRGIVSWDPASAWCPMVWVLQPFPDMAMKHADEAETPETRPLSASVEGFNTPMIPFLPDLMPPLISQPAAIFSK